MPTPLSLKKAIERYNWIRSTLQSGAPLNCTEIAERLGCSIKTAQRYITRLRHDGYTLRYDSGLRGYVIDEPSYHEDLQAMYRLLRSAYVWTKKHCPDAPWLPEAENIFGGGRLNEEA